MQSIAQSVQLNNVCWLKEDCSAHGMVHSLPSGLFEGPGATGINDETENVPHSCYLKSFPFLLQLNRILYD